MGRCIGLLALALGLGLGLGLKNNHQRPTHKGPNVLVIMTDDQGPSIADCPAFRANGSLIRLAPRFDDGYA